MIQSFSLILYQGKILGNHVHLFIIILFSITSNCSNSIWKKFVINRRIGVCIVIIDDENAQDNDDGVDKLLNRSSLFSLFP